MTCVLVEQALESVTVTVYVPIARFIATFEVWTGVVFQEYVKGAVPPVAVTVAEPVLFPEQKTSVWAVIIALIPAGSVIVIGLEIPHPFASVTVTL
jgi:hypothetical protein